MNYKEYIMYLKNTQDLDLPDSEQYRIIQAVSRSDFPQLVELSGGNLSALCRTFGIPLRTAQAWAARERDPSPYLMRLIGFALISLCEKDEERSV